MDCSLPGSSVHGILQARILEWVAMSFSRESSWPRDRTQVSHIAGRFFTIWATRGFSQNKYTIFKWVFSFTMWTKFFTLVVRYWCPSWQTLFRNQAPYLQSICQSTVKESQVQGPENTAPACHRGRRHRNAVCIYYTLNIKVNLSYYCCSVTKLVWHFERPWTASMPDFPVLHYILEFAQIHVHWVGDAI